MKTVVGHRIRVLRSRHGLSQVAFGARVDAVQGTVSAWEVQGHDPGSEMMQRIAKEFGVTVGWLHGEGDDDAMTDTESRVSAEALRHAVEAAADGDLKSLALRLLDIVDGYMGNTRLRITEVEAPLARAQETAQRNLEAVIGRMHGNAPAENTEPEARTAANLEFDEDHQRRMSAVIQRRPIRRE